MDIRKFFGKATDSKKKKKPTAAANTTNAASTTSAAARQQDKNEPRASPSPEKKQRVEISTQDFFAQTAAAPKQTSSPRKHKQEEEEEFVEVPKPPPPKKQKQDSIQVSKENQANKQGDESPKTDAVSVSPSDNEAKAEAPVKPSSLKKRRLVIQDDDDDDDDDEDDVVPCKPSSASKKAKTLVVEEDEDDDDYAGDVETESSPKAKSTPSQKKAAKKSPPESSPKAKSTPSQKKAAKKTPPSKRKSKKEQHKDSLIQPDTKLKSFSTDDAEPECLSGTTFVFSGVLENLSREASEDIVKTLGGRVTSAVSGKTDYLVVGDELEDGRPYTEGSKYRKALSNDVIIVKGEEKLYGLVKQYSDKARSKKPSEPRPTSASKPAPAVAKMPPNPYAKTPANPYAKSAAKATNPYATTKLSTQQTPSKPPAATDPNSLWADKYAPQSTHQILGNQENVKKLTTWLDRWERNFSGPKARGKSFSSPNGPWKAALLSGPPGIGKTTAATIVARESGRDYLEFNASDARSKKALSEGLGDIAGSQAIVFEKGQAKTAKRRCIIMDEVDGMGAGDRSGMAELIKMIKRSMVPIICICNDRQSQKMKSLLPYCLDLRFRRPVKSVIARRALQIGQQEGMKIEMNAAEAIAESCGNDIRQVLNVLQMWASKEGASMTYKELKDRQASINKDEILRVSMFDATKMIIEGRRGLSGADAKAERESFFKRSNAFFVDYSFMGLMVHQNYPKVLMGQFTEAKRQKDEAVTLAFVEQMYDATAAMSDLAVAEHSVRSGDQNWGLLPFAGAMAVKTGYHAGGEHGGFLPGFPEFTGWMGKNSTRGKKNRLLQELGHHMNYKISGDSQELRMSYLPVLRERFASLITAEDGTKTDEAIELMDEYGLDRDDVFENLDEFKMDPKAKPLASVLDSKQKAAFTRAYNAGSHKSQALVDEQGGGKTTRRMKSSSSMDLADPEVVDDDKREESEEEIDEKEAEKQMEMFKKKAKKAAAKKNKKSSGKGKKKK